MNSFVVLGIAICCLSTAQARPGLYHHGSAQQLVGVPDLSAFGKLSYPKYDLLELGSITKDSLPPAVVHITKEVTVKVPQPYPVKIPHPVPYPVHVAKPYPVVETKIIKVPQPVPYEVVKKIPVHIEVPKPYPVSADEYKSGGGGGQLSYGGSFEGGNGGYQQLSAGYGHEGAVQDGGYGGGYGVGQDVSSYGGHGEGDQSAGYQALVQLQQQSGADGGHGEEQLQHQEQEQH